jgi:hypothetical protein
LKYTKQLLVNDEMGEDNRDHCSTFPRASTDQNRGYVLPVFSFFKIIDNTNSKLIHQKFNHSDMMGDIAESQEYNKKIDLKFVIGTEDTYDEFAY